MSKISDQYRVFLICAALAIVTFVAFEPVRSHDFINYDDPDSDKAHVNLGTAMAKRGNFDKAIEHFNEAMRIRPDFPAVQAMLERAITSRRNADKAPAN